MSNFFEDDWKPLRGAGAPKVATGSDDERTRLLACLDGETPVRMLPAISGLARERVLILLGELLKEGRLVEAPTTAPRSEEEPEDDEGTFDEEDLEEAEEDEEDEAPRTNLRLLYEAELRELDVDGRVAVARIAEGELLLACTLDPHPRVVAAILENERVGLPHARSLARHHRTATGLGILCRVVGFARDAEVQRRLLRNPQLTEGLFGRLMRGKQLLECHKLVTSRDITDRARSAAKRLLRARFPRADSDEKLALIIKTDARCLAHLQGLSLDGRTLAKLCGRTTSSALYIQNFARWSSTPPPLLIHLSRQKVVERQRRLFTLLAQHPNAPSQLKKKGFGEIP
ncbi:MAG: hypothetical protein P1V51_13670 [Deltaproteobacteria bacterium]|nr:hypothetical protein [Deltaproteobacteria bacterium]